MAPGKKQKANDKISVLIIEDNLLTRMGTEALLKTQEDIQVCGQAASGKEGLALYREQRPDVVIVDMRMPEMSGVEVIEALMRDGGTPRILVLTHYDGDETIFRALKAGARGYVTKNADAGLLLKAIRSVASGEQFLPAEIADKLAERSARPTLTLREGQVLEQVQLGLTNKVIANNLGLSEGTVHNYVEIIRAKLGASTRTEAVSIAIERGILVADGG